MEYKMLIGETLLDFRVAHSIKWKAEDKLFLYENEIYHQKVDITIEMVDEFPELIKKELYVTEGMQIGVDKNNNEVRKYRATFLTGKPVYALSILKDEKIKIYFKNVNNIWNNPNIRVWNLIHMENILLNVNALVLHCSYLRYENQAILFSAPSGTGKQHRLNFGKRIIHVRLLTGIRRLSKRRTVSGMLVDIHFMEVQLNV